MPRATPAHPGLLGLPCAIPESTSPPQAQMPASSVHLAFTARILEPERPSSAQPTPTAQPVCPAAPSSHASWALFFPSNSPILPTFLPSCHSFIRSQSTEGLLCIGHQAHTRKPSVQSSLTASALPPPNPTPHSPPTLLFLFPPSVDSPTLGAHLLSAPSLGAPASTWTTDCSRLLSSAVLVWGDSLGWPPELCLERGPAVTSGFWGHDKRDGRAIATAGLLAQNTLRRSPHLHQHVHRQVPVHTHMHAHTLSQRTRTHLQTHKHAHTVHVHTRTCCPWAAQHTGRCPQKSISFVTS